MRMFAVMVLQLVVAVLVTGLLLPAVLMEVPSMQSNVVGPYLVYGGILGIFLLVRYVWPRRDRHRQDKR
jgi:hypothetical protein